MLKILRTLLCGSKAETRLAKSDDSLCFEESSGSNLVFHEVETCRAKKAHCEQQEAE